MKLKNYLIFILLTHRMIAQDFSFYEIVNENGSSNQGDYVRTIDFDNDGDLDILQAGGTNSTDLKVFINDGSGNFVANIVHSYNQSIDFEIGDLDNDGDEDILVYGTSLGYQVHENLSGSFAAPIALSLSAGGTIRIADIVDVDGDGINDIVTALSGTYDPGIVWARNQGSFIFTPNELLLSKANYNGNTINYFEILDIDNDNDLDAFVITESTDMLWMTINNTVDTLTTTINLGGYRSDISFGDLNGDNYVDLAVANVDPSIGEIKILINDQSNGFTGTTIKGYSWPLRCTAVEAIDYDQDNDLDLVVGEIGYLSRGNAKLFINNGSGTFTEDIHTLQGSRMSYVQSGTGRHTIQAHGGDFNTDGLYDILINSNQDQDLILHAKQMDGSFQPAYINYHMQSLTRMQYLDIDGDGFKDFVSIDQVQNGKVVINYNDGTNNFKNRESVVFDNIPRQSIDVLLGDWNGNADIDLFYASTKYVYLVNDFFNTTARDTTLLYTSAPTNTSSYLGNLGLTNNLSNALQLIDVDNDMDMDLIVVDNISNENKISWIENDGGTYTVHQSSIDMDSYELIDLNSDNHPDLVYTKAVGSFERYVRIAFFNPLNNLWEFQEEENTQNVSPSQFAMADVDVDGDKDIVFRGRWMENLGGGTFVEDLAYSGAIGSTDGITSADINQDGMDDLISVVADGGDNTQIDVFMNQGSNSFTKTDMGSGLNFPFIGHANMPLLIEDIDGDGLLDIASSFHTGGGSYSPYWFRTCYNTSSTITPIACGTYTAPSGAIFTESGTFQDIIPNAIGCDSLITINLTINPIYNETANASICEGETFTFGTQSLTQSGQFTEVFQSQAGCDSTVVLNLSVNPTYNQNSSATICSNETFILGSQTLTTSGEYTEVFQSVFGCDSTVVLSLVVNPAYTIDTTVVINNGESFFFDGNSLTSDQVVTGSFNTVQSCDSIVNLTLVVNDPPSIQNQTFAIDENSANGSSVGTVVASDPDGDALTYVITAGNTDGAFALDASTGVLTVANITALDFETTPSFALTVEVSDGALNASATVTINLNDVDESTNTAPTIADQTFAIDENSANGSNVGTVVASDPDGDALTYAITTGNTDGAFALDASTGVLTVANTTALDFEATPSFALTVEVSDGALNASATVTINLNDVDESTNTAPTIADQTFAIDENSANGSNVGTVVASDPDGDALTYAITTGNTDGAFALDASTGVLTVANTTALDFEATPSFALTVEVSDGALNASATVTINLNDVDENALGLTKDQEAQIYPNPTASSFTLTTAKGKEINEILLVSMEGKIVKRFNQTMNHMYNIEDLGEGTYIILIRMSEQTYVAGRLVKE